MIMYKITTLNKISAGGLSALAGGTFDVSDSHDAPDGIIVRSAAMHDMKFPESLLAIARAGAGVNNIPVDKCAENGVVVFNTPGANANAVKELAIAALLISSRGIVDGINWVKTLAGTEGVAKAVEAGKGAYAGPEITGKTLGVIGLGAIGVLVANAAVALGMDVVGFDPFLSVESAWSISRHVRKARSMDEVYAASDYVSLHLPFNKDTKCMINAETIAKMKDGARVINLARAELADSAAIKAALVSGKISRYVTDFPTDDTAGAEGVIAIPHLGASTQESEENCAMMAAAELKDYLLYGNIKNSVNFPSAELPESGKPRLSVLHKNEPGIIGAITTILGNKGINVENLVNKSKADMAYTLLEIDGDGESVKAGIRGIKDIIRVRVIV
jgi:D-3-phosphoglycerate dehydrogenase